MRHLGDLSEGGDTSRRSQLVSTVGATCTVQVFKATTENSLDICVELASNICPHQWHMFSGRVLRVHALSLLFDVCMTVL